LIACANRYISCICSRTDILHSEVPYLPLPSLTFPFFS
jgi:hypothetical protein